MHAHVSTLNDSGIRTPLAEIEMMSMADDAYDQKNYVALEGHYTPPPLSNVRKYHPIGPKYTYCTPLFSEITKTR